MINRLFEYPGDMLPAFGRVFTAFEKLQLHKINLTVPQSYTLLTIFENKTISMNELSNKSRVTQTTMTRIIDNLVRDGYVARNRKEEDRRVVEVELTAQGQQKVKELKKLLDETGMKVFVKVPEEKRLQVAESLVILLDIMEEVLIKPE